jgi:hypothetical protein
VVQVTLKDIKEFVMSQTGNDVADVTEYMPFLLEYINEGYDRLVYATAREHIAADSESYPPLADDADTPNLPIWAHLAIANWATWCVYRNGNPSKQSRGVQFRAAAEETATQIRGGSNTASFFNMPT